MLTSVAFVVCQVRVVGCPGSRVFGLAESEAVGAGIDGGGAGGGGATFFAHAPRNIIAPSVTAKLLHLIVIALFTEFLLFLCASIF
jgi:hypothetical protein